MLTKRQRKIAHPDFHGIAERRHAGDRKHHAGGQAHRQQALAIIAPAGSEARDASGSPGFMALSEISINIPVFGSGGLSVASACDFMSLRLSLPASSWHGTEARCRLRRILRVTQSLQCACHWGGDVVIASEAKQSIMPRPQRGLLRRFASRNDKRQTPKQKPPLLARVLSAVQGRPKPGGLFFCLIAAPKFAPERRRLPPFAPGSDRRASWRPDAAWTWPRRCPPGSTGRR